MVGVDVACPPAEKATITGRWRCCGADDDDEDRNPLEFFFNCVTFFFICTIGTFGGS